MSINHAALKVEVAVDPVSLGYAVVIQDDRYDETIADMLNDETTGRTASRGQVLTEEIFAQFDEVELAAVLSSPGVSGDREREALTLIAAVGIWDVYNPSLYTLMDGAFGASSTSETNLIAWRDITASRAVELFAQAVTPTDVAIARNLP